MGDAVTGDPVMGARSAGDGRDGFGLPVDIAFLAAYGIAPALLSEAATVASRLGVWPAQQVLATGLVDEPTFYRALADSLHLRFSGVPPPLSPGADVDASLRQGVVPTAATEPGIRFACAPPPGPLLRRFIASIACGRADVVVVPPAALAAALRRTNARTIAERAAWLDADGLARVSARDGSTPLQKLVAIGLTGPAAFLATLFPLGALFGLALTLGPLFLGAVVLRLAALMEKPAPDLWRSHRWRVDDARLPVYTVAVPLLGEEAVLDQILKAMAALDYPPAKLDIRLLIEETDPGMCAAVAARALPPFVTAMIVPAGIPRTKPRALNLALAEAHGSLFTIFDAEDRPDPQQLRMAAARFLHAPPDLVCLQARLVIDNAADGALTRLFALEYAGLFDVLNPALLRCGLPIMLGGTSNHFRTEALRRIGGWDPWNVTEDADIGFRLVRQGGRIADLPSPTLEEAPPHLRAWLKQRVRWLKGYLQTAISHLVAPHRFLGEAGPSASAAFLVLVLGTLVSTLGYPVFLVATAVALVDGSFLSPQDGMEALLAALALSLMVLGTLVVFLVPALGAKRRGAPELARWLCLIPFYLLLASLAGWLALLEYLRRPFGWNKTQHGLARSSRYGHRLPGEPGP